MLVGHQLGAGPPHQSDTEAPSPSPDSQPLLLLSRFGHGYSTLPGYSGSTPTRSRGIYINLKKRQNTYIKNVRLYVEKKSLFTVYSGQSFLPQNPDTALLTETFWPPLVSSDLLLPCFRTETNIKEETFKSAIW